MDSNKPEGDAIYLARQECGICNGSPLGKPCHTDFSKERVELPALMHADALCIRALESSLLRTPTRIRKTSTTNSWQLIEGAIKLSEAPVYKSTVKEWLNLAFGIAEHVKERPYEGAEEQIQSRKILAFEPMYRDQYLYDGENMEVSMAETARRLGQLVGTIDERASEYHNHEETGIAMNLSAECEVAYIGLRAQIPFWPASNRQDKSSVKRNNFDLYVAPSHLFTPTQVRNSYDPRTYDSSIFNLDYAKFRRDVMSKCGSKERDYFPLVRRMIKTESTDTHGISNVKLRPLNTASKHMSQLIFNHQEAVLKHL